MEISGLSVFDVSGLHQDKCREILFENHLIPDARLVSKMFPADYQDLLRLALLVQDRGPKTVLEFGSGQSSFVIAASLAHLALNNPQGEYEFHTVEASEEYSHQVRELFDSVNVPSNLKLSTTRSNVSLQVVNERFCTLYDTIPNVRPDLVYLDGPSPEDCFGSIRGFSANFDFRMPMAADLIFLEYFLEPGAVILTDGRSANARFLRDTFTQDWWHYHDIPGDVHYFELVEDPLGEKNRIAMVERFGGRLLRDSRAKWSQDYEAT